MFCGLSVQIQHGQHQYHRFGTVSRKSQERFKRGRLGVKAYNRSVLEVHLECLETVKLC